MEVIKNADQIIRMATEETAAENAKLKAELAEVKNRADQEAKAAADAKSQMKNIADAIVYSSCMKQPGKR